MIILPKSDIIPSEITEKSVFDNRRTFIKQAGFGLAAAAVSSKLSAATVKSGVTTGDGMLIGRANQTAKPQRVRKAHTKIKGYKKTAYGKGLKQTEYKHVTSYNNFYEFGTGKDEPALLSEDFKTDPWSITIEGEVKSQKVITIQDILKNSR